MKSSAELRELHGEEYVAAFEGQSPRRLGRLMEHVELSPGDRVADFGCGNGMLLELVAGRVASYVGVDFSEPFIGAAEERKERLGLAEARFECAEIGEFCRRHPEAFDVAFAMDFSEHVYDEPWKAILESLRSSLVRGGRLYLHTPNADFFVERLKDRNLLLKQFPEHVAVRTAEHNAALVRSAGLEVTRTLLLPHYNVLRHLHLLSRLPGVGPLFEARILLEARRPAGP